MDENLTSHVNSRIPGNGVILSGFKSSRNPQKNPRIPHGFHTNRPFRTAHPAAPRSTHQRTDTHTYEENRTIGRVPCRSAICKDLNPPYPFLIRSIAAATSATRNLTALPILK